MNNSKAGFTKQKTPTKTLKLQPVQFLIGWSKVTSRYSEEYKN